MQVFVRPAHAVLLALIMVAAALPAGSSRQASAQVPDGIVFSELHYHPQQVGDAFPEFDDREDTEFAELVNLGDSAIDVGNWCVREAVDFCFPAGTRLEPQDPFVITRDDAAFSDVHGFSAQGEYNGRLANGGELIRLVDDLGTVVTQLAWGTANPWPTTPDGAGPSLELVAVEGANGAPSNWAASALTDGTPGVVPSLSGAAPPLVTSHTAPTPAIAGQTITLTAMADNATTLTVTYNVDFGEDVATAMTANGGQWTVDLPPLAGGGLLRFRFEATGPGGTTTSPRVDDSITWWATAVPTNPVSGVPTLDIHLSDTNWSGIEARTCGCTAVIVHDGRVWTDVEIRRAGLTSINNPKGHYRLDFPPGHPFEASWLVDSSDELTLDMGWTNVDIMREQLSWQMMADVGFPEVQTQHVRVSRNGAFHGLYLMRDEQDGDWRSRHGFDRGAFYKFDRFGGKAGWGGGWTKKEALDEPDTDLAAFLTCLNSSGAARRSCLLAQADVAQMVNEIAATSVIRNVDQREFNWFLYRDDTQNGLWRLLPDDLDRTWGIGGTNVAAPVSDSGQPYRRCIGTDGPPANEVCRAIMAVPEFETMVNRRLRTLTDEHLADPKWQNAVTTTAALIEADWNDDEARWNRTSASFATIVGQLQSWITTYVAHLRAGGHDNKVPAAQSANPAVTIVETRPSAADGISWAILSNPSATESVDVSGWAFNGQATITNGAVILPGATLAVTNDDAAFLSANPDFADVRARLEGSFAGETTLVRRDGSLVDGFGTPTTNAIVLNEWNAVNASSVLPLGDPVLGTAAGNGGDWFELVVVEDGLDVRGWRLVLSDADGANPGVRDEFVFADRPELADLEGGSIITISEDRADDLTVMPVRGDWHINLQANDFDAGQFFTAESQENFDTNHENWQLAIYDDQGTLVFGPAGEGIGSVSGVTSREVGELEADPSASVDRLTDYGDGDGSTYGAPNVTEGVPQDLSALRFPYRLGDVNCDGGMDIVDALLIAQHEVGNRVSEPRCPLTSASTGTYLGAGDLDDSGSPDIVDALIIAQCAVGIIDSGLCPEP
ncbi:MAG: CotH kinase family protein [Actinomycetota bacterium]